MGTQGVHMKGVLPWLVCWARCAGSRDFYPALAAQAGLVQNFFFLTGHYFLPPSKRQAVVLRRLSLNKCLWVEPPSAVISVLNSKVLPVLTKTGAVQLTLYLYHRASHCPHRPLCS